MRDNTDNLPLMDARDITAALGLLSRMPIRIDTDRATARGARAAWAYPLAGLALGLIAGVLAQIALWLGLPASLAAGLALATLVILTGAMHEDGLADSADGLWGGWDRARRLAIMKDSHIGVYGVAALVLSLGLRWQALAVLIAHGHLWSALIVAAMLSRAAMVPVMARLPHARDSGLSQSVGRPSGHIALIAVAIAALAAVLMFFLTALWVFITVAAATFACARIARSKIGGQTGDILGATQQITEITLLLTLAATIT